MSFDLNKKWLFSLLGRITVFLVLFSVMIIFLYLIGNYQDFLDTSQFFLLKLIETISLAGGISSVYYLAFLFIIALAEKKIMILRFILTLIAIALCFFFFSGIKFLFSWFVY